MDLMWPRLCEEIDFARDSDHPGSPVYLFAGRQDRITDLAQIEEWHATLNAPAKQLEVVDGAGHLNLYEEPEHSSPSWSQVRAKAHLRHCGTPRTAPAPATPTADASP